MFGYIFAELCDGYVAGWLYVYYTFRVWLDVMLTPYNDFDNTVLFDYALGSFQPLSSSLLEEHIHEALDLF